MRIDRRYVMLGEVAACLLGASAMLDHVVARAGFPGVVSVIIFSLVFICGILVGDWISIRARPLRRSRRPATRRRPGPRRRQEESARHRG